MNFLTSIIPGPSVLYRIAAYALLAASLIGFGWFKGSEHWHGVLIEAQARALIEGGRITAAREKVTTVVLTKYLPQLVKQQVVTETIIKEVPVYVPASTPDLPGGFRVLADAAAAGRVPDPAEGANAAPVPARAFAESLVANYSGCKRNEILIDGLQEWIVQQGKVR